MKRNTAYKLFTILLVFSLTLWGRIDQQKNTYQQALEFERSGEYAKAESLFVNLYENDPDNYNYYNRYRNILLLQRKFSQLKPVMEKRSQDRSHDRYLKLELGMLYYALDEKNKARSLWDQVFKGLKRNVRNSYATAVYQDALEYRTGNEFHNITAMLRSITDDPALLINYNFALALRYRNWDPAVNEMLHILNTNPKELRHVRQSIFRYDPVSALYPKAIHALEKTSLYQGINLLADIYVHLGEFEKAYDVYERNIEDFYVRNDMTIFAQNMFDQGRYELAAKTAEKAEQHLAVENVARTSMVLLSAQAQEAWFYEMNRQKEIVSYPYESEFLAIDFPSFDRETSKHIEIAYEIYDSLSTFSGKWGEKASMQHAEISYRVYQDFDAAIQEYSALASKRTIDDKAGLIAKLCKLMLAKGEYAKAVNFIQNAARDFGLMVHEEDALLPYELYTSVIAGEKDSIMERADKVLAMLPLDDPGYNDMLVFTAVVNTVIRDSLNYDAWLEAERYILMNNTASAIDIYKSLLEQNPQASQIFALRYLDCLNAQRDMEAEVEFWAHHYETLIKSDMNDYFILRYAGFMEKMQKFDIAYEIFEKYLLSYQESMYYENIREYVREHYSLGAP